MIIQPLVILTLGNFALSYIFKKFGLEPERVGRLHRKVFRMKNLMFDLRTILLYRPAAAVYNYNQEMKKVLIKDFESMVGIQNGIKRVN